jgi:hypothetical protein
MGSRPWVTQATPARGGAAVAATRSHRRSSRALLQAFALYLVSLPIFLNFSLPVYTTWQRLLAWGIFCVAGVPFFHAISSRWRGVPILPLVAGQYIVFFALPVFFEDAVRTLDGWITPDSAAIDMTLFCALLSFISIGLGYMFAGKIFRFRVSFLHFAPSPRKLFLYAVITLVGGILLAFGQGSILGWEPGSLVRPISVILSADLGVAILACLYYQDLLARWQQLVAIFLVLVSVIIGFSGGMFQSAVQPLLIWAVCRWVIRGKAPVAALIVIGAAFFIIQPVKGSYRSIALLSGRTFTTSEKVTIYVKLLQDQWLTPDNSAGKSTIVHESRQSAKKRLSLLMATAHYVEWTPYPFPYRNGSTLGYLVYGWIPRALWPDKPIAQEANKLLPVDYNVQSVTNQNTTMFGVGHVAEAYVNFGLFGIMPLFFALGALYRVPQKLLERRPSTATVAIFVATAVLMVPIGSSISDAFGGFLQQIFVQGLLLRFFTVERRNRISDPARFTPPMPAAWPNAGERQLSLPRRSSL